jgi:hypothetical protein
MILIFLSIEKCVFSRRFDCQRPPIWPPALPLNLTYVWLVRSKLPSGSLPYTNLTFNVRNLISIFCSLGRLSKESVQVWGSVRFFVTSLFLWWRVVSPSPNPQAGGLPLLSVRGCLFNIFAANLHGWRSFLHLQREDVPCCGDWDPT